MFRPILSLVKKAQEEPISWNGVDESVEPAVVPRQFVEVAPESISNGSVHAALTTSIVSMHSMHVE